MNVHKATIYSSITSFFKSSWISEHRQRRCHQWSWCTPAHRHHSSLWQTKIHHLFKILKFDIVTFVLLSPSFFAFWTDIIFPSSSVQTAVTSLPSGVVSSKGSPSWLFISVGDLELLLIWRTSYTLNCSCIVLRVVDVLIVQTPPSSVISQARKKFFEQYFLWQSKRFY